MHTCKYIHVHVVFFWSSHTFKLTTVTNVILFTCLRYV